MGKINMHAAFLQSRRTGLKTLLVDVALGSHYAALLMSATNYRHWYHHEHSSWACDHD
jgi:hypothetical protein